MTTTLSFRAEEQLAAALDAEAARSGVARSDLLNRAVREMLYRLQCERDAEVYARMPLTEDEIVTWGSEAWPTDDAATNWSEVFSG